MCNVLLNGNFQMVVNFNVRKELTEKEYTEIMEKGLTNEEIIMRFIDMENEEEVQENQIQIKKSNLFFEKLKYEDDGWLEEEEVCCDKNLKCDFEFCEKIPEKDIIKFLETVFGITT